MGANDPAHEIVAPFIEANLHVAARLRVNISKPCWPREKLKITPGLFVLLGFLPASANFPMKTRFPVSA